MKSILIKPIITEKSMQEANRRHYTFAVATHFNKAEIAAEIKKVFGVSVLSIKTVTVKGKTKRTGKKRIESTTSSWKKAIVEVAKDQKIDLFDTTENAEKS